MKLIHTEHSLEKGHLNIWIEHKHEMYGTLVTKVSYRLKDGSEIKTTTTHLTEGKMEKHAHQELIAELRKDEAFKAFAGEQVAEFLAKQAMLPLKVQSVFVMSVEVRTIREERFVGKHLKEEEVTERKEYYIYAAVQLEGIEEEVHVNLQHKQGKYAVKILKEYYPLVQPRISFGWEHAFIEELLPLVKERIRIGLP